MGGEAPALPAAHKRAATAITPTITLKTANPKLVVLLLFSIFVPPFVVFIKVALSL